MVRKSEIRRWELTEIFLDFFFFRTFTRTTEEMSTSTKRRPLNVSESDRGLLPELNTLIRGVDENSSNTDPLKYFLETAKGDQLLTYWAACGEV